MDVKDDVNVMKVLMEQTVKPHVLALLWSEEFLFSGPYTQSLSRKEKYFLYIFVAYRS
jgi:hypothetical protein